MHFVDSNIVLRLVGMATPELVLVQRAVETLESRGEAMAIGLQVLAETWVVATRPISAKWLRLAGGGDASDAGHRASSVHAAHG